MIRPCTLDDLYFLPASDAVSAPPRIHHHASVSEFNTWIKYRLNRARLTGFFIQIYQLARQLPYPRQGLPEQLITREYTQAIRRLFIAPGE